MDHAAGCGVIACDIPSGLNGFAGRAWDPCVQADFTLTFQIAKHGHFLQDGLDLCGQIITADVGFPREIFPEKLPRLFEPRDLKTCFIPRRRNIHKGSCGHLLIVAGSVGMAGAAALCAKAALRSGVGLVTIACAEEIVPILQMHAPCAMCLPLPQKNGAICEDALPILESALAGKSAAAIGPGLSRRVPPEIIAAVLKSGLPAAIDADALNIISENPQLKSLLGRQHILTPHPGEAERLLGHKCEDPIADARALADLGCTAVLKGASRVICDGEDCCISASGAGGMARGGSGDVLTGILGALLAEKSARTPLQTALCACEIHGLAGAAAYAKFGRAMNAADSIDFLPEVFMRYAD
jgi:NAD(P)H-hydrate epimerase